MLVGSKLGWVQFQNEYFTEEGGETEKRASTAAETERHVEN
jgi:hypothetical protein